jgi:hypothetical protein
LRFLSVRIASSHDLNLQRGPKNDDEEAAPQEGLPWYEDGDTPDLTGTGIEVSQLIMDGEVTYLTSSTP